MIKTKILNAIPRNKSDAMTMSELSDKISSSWTLYNEHLIRKNVKQLRSEWHKIIWCNRWSYITENKAELKKMVKTIESSKYWFINWMNKIIKVIS